jgi:hypothetical protein
MTLMSWRRLLIWAAALLVLAAVFLAYLQPQLMQQLSEQLWSCF